MGYSSPWFPRLFHLVVLPNVESGVSNPPPVSVELPVSPLNAVPFASQVLGGPPVGEYLHTLIFPTSNFLFTHGILLRLCQQFDVQSTLSEVGAATPPLPSLGYICVESTFPVPSPSTWGCVGISRGCLVDSISLGHAS